MKKVKSKSKDLRQILISRSISPNGKRRQLLMTEIIEKDGVLARAQKRYNYYVSEKIGMVLGNKTLKEWATDTAQVLNEKPRHVNILRIVDRKSGLGKTSYRTTGSFYVIQKNKVIAIAFLHSVKFDILGSVSKEIPPHPY